MSKVRIEAYLSLGSFNRLEELRKQGNDRGYTGVLNACLDTLWAAQGKHSHQIENYKKTEEYLYSKIKNLEYELKEKSGGKKKNEKQV